MGGWVWKYVAAPLRAEGHIVHTPTLTGFGERHHLISRDITTATHVADVVNLTRFEDVENAVLVVHSYAGTIAPGILAEAGDRISNVVYIDEIVPRAGESVVEALGFMSTEHAAVLRALTDRGTGRTSGRE